VSGTILLDVTRMAAWRWIGRPPTGLDRVCEAYARHFAPEALAVLQIAGHARVLDRRRSARLFDAFEAPAGAFRRNCARLLGSPQRNHSVGGDAVYLNVGHSGFDREAHWHSLAGLAAKRVYLLHDLIPITHPHLTTAHKTARHRGRVRKALARADGIVANSQATADGLAGFAQSQGVPPPPILAAPIAARSLPQVNRTSTGRPYFLCIGTIEPRKNHALLLRVWSRLIERMGHEAPQLVIAGKRGASASAILSALEGDGRLRDIVTVRSGLSDSDLGTLLAGARALVFPTLAEGFGLPVAEALQAGVPAIASDLPALREVGQGIPALLDPADETAWVETIGTYCGQSADRDRQLAAMAQFRATTWADHFASVEEWLAKLPARRLDRREGGSAMRTPMGDSTQDRAWQC